MSKKYCKKSSIQTVTDEVKTRKGSSSHIQGNNIASDINNLVIPTQRGAPATILTASSTTKTIQRGKYTGGSVSVVPQHAIATLSKSGGDVSIESGKTLASVKIPASNLYQVITGNITPANNATSLTFSGMSFTPVGFVAVMVTASGGVGNPYIGGIAYTDGHVYGIAAGNTEKYGVPIIDATISISDSSITVSNIQANENGSIFAAKFKNNPFVYAVWG